MEAVTSGLVVGFHHCIPRFVGKDKRRIAKILGAGFGALAVALLVFSFGYFLGHSGGNFDALADSYAAQYQAETHHKVEECLRDRSADAARACVEDAVISSHEEWRAEQDLSAQRQMAQWAWWLLIVTALQIPLSALGLFFLLRTLWQSQESNAISMQAIEADNRPWIEIVITKKGLVISDTGARFVGECKLINRGKSPAGGVLPYPALTAVHGMGALENTALPRAKEVVDGWNEKDAGLGFSIFPGGNVDHHLIPVLVPQQLEAALGGQSGYAVFFLAVVARYRFGDKVGETAVTFRLSFNPMLIDLTALPRTIDDADLTLKDTHKGYAK
jgi:hypothetical protein